jgi:tRNA modification GTPase
MSTICAISTAPGTGGIAVIRISGEDALATVGKIFRSDKKPVEKQTAHTLSHGWIYKSDEALDEATVAVFRAPHSFTGEDTVEITCHGSVYIQQEILHLLIDNGSVLARPGEFTQRAFLNGKMDLSQAEAVADLVSSASSAAHRLAINQMRGGFSRELQVLRAQLLEFVSLIELELDFGEEDVQFADRNRLLDLSSRIETVIARLLESFRWGNVIKNGIPVAIVGETNAGKSTLLNHLLNEEKAIVSDIHGTTRDAIEDVVNIQGLMFRFIDTAGIRYTGDAVENLGIERTFRKIEQAAIVLWMIDTTHYNKETEFIADQIVSRTKDKTLIIVINKIDKLTPEEQAVLDEEFLPYVPSERIYLSAKYKTNTDVLEKALLKAAGLPEIGDNDVVISNVRHHEALAHALEAICRAKEGIQTSLSGDLLAQDIRECMHYLGEITGEITTEEVLGNIFGKFCIGK